MQKCKERVKSTKTGLGAMPSDAALRWRKHQNAKEEFSKRNPKFLLHPSRRMAWENLRHGVVENFLSPRKNIGYSLTNKDVPIKFYKIS